MTRCVSKAKGRKHVIIVYREKIGVTAGRAYKIYFRPIDHPSFNSLDINIKIPILNSQHQEGSICVMYADRSGKVLIMLYDRNEKD